MCWKNIEILAIISIKPYQDLLELWRRDKTLDKSRIYRGRESEAEEPIFCWVLTH